MRLLRGRFIALAWPLFAELLLSILVGLIGLWLVSRVSDTASGAFALANNVQASFFLLFRVISIGVSVVITQNLGAGDRQNADRCARASLGAGTWLGLATGGVVAIFSGQLLQLVNAPSDVQVLAEPYLRMLAFSLVLDAFNACMGAVLRAHMHSRDALVNVIAINGIHLLACIPLMNGMGPIAPMGMAGFALAAALGRCVGFALYLSFWRWRLDLIPTISDWWVVRWHLLRPMLDIGLPGAAENIAYRLALMASLAMVANMGSSALAAYSYTMQVMHLILVFSLAVGFSCEILVGHLVGARKLRQAHRVVSKSVGWGMLVSATVALLAALSAPWLLTFFTHEPDVIRTCTTLLWVAVVLEPGRALNLIVINALRATGDAKFPVAAGAVSMLVVMAGGAWLLGVYFELGLLGIWVAYALDEWTRGVTMCVRWWRCRWVPAARAVNHRLIRQRREFVGSSTNSHQYDSKDS